MTSERLERVFTSLLDSLSDLNDDIHFPFLSIDNNGDGVFSIQIVVSQSFKGVPINGTEEEQTSEEHRHSSPAF